MPTDPPDYLLMKHKHSVSKIYINYSNIYMRLAVTIDEHLFVVLDTYINILMLNTAGRGEYELR
jgi:hypothetical protein